MTKPVCTGSRVQKGTCTTAMQSKAELQPDNDVSCESKIADDNIPAKGLSNGKWFTKEQLETDMDKYRATHQIARSVHKELFAALEAFAAFQSLRKPLFTTFQSFQISFQPCLAVLCLV